MRAEDDDVQLAVGPLRLGPTSRSGASGNKKKCRANCGRNQSRSAFIHLGIPQAINSSGSKFLRGSKRRLGCKSAPPSRGPIILRPIAKAIIGREVAL